MTKIALIGAFDRNNYGDVLMPVVFQEYFKNKKNDYEFDYFGLADSNMEEIKGFKTKALYRIKDEEMKFDVAVLVGGEILTSQYSNMYLNLQTNKNKIFLYKIINKFFKRTFNRFARKKLNGKEEFPWIIGKNTVGDTKIIYNTVGGKDCKITKEVINNFNNASYISTRDEETYKHLKYMNIKTELKLYPDSVISVSEVINDNKLKENINKELYKKISNFGNYFVLQCKKNMKKRYGKEIITILANEIEKIYKEYKVGCILLPIGYAQGHEDLEILKEIYNNVKTKKMLIENNNIFDTIYVIKNSSLYCGTSLHGAITSISYAIPHFALTNKVQKLVDFLKTWNTSKIVYTNPENLLENFGKIYNNNENLQNLKKVRKNMIDLAIENFENIDKYIKEKS